MAKRNRFYRSPSRTKIEGRGRSISLRPRYNRLTGSTALLLQHRHLVCRMDDIIDEFVKVARRCDRAAKPLLSGPLKEMAGRLEEACGEVGLSWSQSVIGYHATVYTVGFRRPLPGEFFDPEWGIQGGYSNRSAGHWTIVDYDAVKNEILRRANVNNVTSLVETSNSAGEVFDDTKAELLPLFDALLSELKDDKVLQGLRGNLEALESHVSMVTLAKAAIPRGHYATRDSLAMNQGFRAPHHTVFNSWLLERFSFCHAVGEVAKIARHAARYLEQKYKMKGKSFGKKDGRIFIGHGRSSDWNVVKDFIRDRLSLDYDEFNRDSPAGLTGKERLEQMLDNACFALLVMTAEDEHADGTRHARENVIHEVGLFQGRLGFQRAIILLEEGCEEFSNIAGIQQIRFKKGDIQAKKDEIRQVLEREGIL